MIDSDPLRVPIAWGVKVSATVQEPFGASVPPAAQVPARAKSPALVPPTASVCNVRFAEPVFDTVTTMGAEVVSNVWPPKLIVAVESLIAAAGVPALGLAM